MPAEMETVFRYVEFAGPRDQHEGASKQLYSVIAKLKVIPMVVTTMNAKRRMLFLAIAISCMLAVSVVHVQLQPDSRTPVQYVQQRVASDNNLSFQSIINESFYGSNSPTTLFSPFTVSDNTVQGKYVNFVILPNGPSGIELSQFNLNQSPMSRFPEPLFSYMSIISNSTSPVPPRYREVGPIFYVIISNSVLVLIHDDPQGIIQVYTKSVSVSVSITLAGGLKPLNSLTPPTSQKTFSAVDYTNANASMTGYIMTSGSNLSHNSTTVSPVYNNEVLATVPAYSFFTTVQVPNTGDAFGNAMHYLAQGMEDGSVSYFASAAQSGNSFAYEASYAIPSMAVTSVSMKRNNIDMTVSSSGSNGPAVMVFLFGGDLYDLTGNAAHMFVNGVRDVQQEGLTSILLNGPGNSTSYNVTHANGYTLVAISSPNQISSIRLASPSSSGFLSSLPAAASATIPFAAALSVIAIASVALYRRKSKGDN